MNECEPKGDVLEGEMRWKITPATFKPSLIINQNIMKCRKRAEVKTFQGHSLFRRDYRLVGLHVNFRLLNK